MLLNLVSNKISRKFHCCFQVEELKYFARITWLPDLGINLDITIMSAWSKVNKPAVGHCRIHRLPNILWLSDWSHELLMYSHITGLAGSVISCTNHILV